MLFGRLPSRLGNNSAAAPSTRPHPTFPPPIAFDFWGTPIFLTLSIWTFLESNRITPDIEFKLLPLARTTVRPSFLIIRKPRQRLSIYPLIPFNRNEYLHDPLVHTIPNLHSSYYLIITGYQQFSRTKTLLFRDLGCCSKLLC